VHLAVAAEKARAEGRADGRHVAERGPDPPGRRRRESGDRKDEREIAHARTAGGSTKAQKPAHDVLPSDSPGAAPVPSPVFPAVTIPHLAEAVLPAVHRVRLDQPTAPAIADIEGAVHEALSGSAELAALAPGSRVAIAVGSRGIADLARLVRATVAHLRGQGQQPFIVPAMGSHGGATAEGQAAVLKKLGVDEAGVGAPVRASMATIELGHTDDGIPCRFDAEAAGSDAVVVIARVKSHTSFDRPIESGLLKMLAVGLGKQDGARNVHRLGPAGFTETIPALAAIALAKAPIACGLAVVESAAHQLVTIEAVPPAAFASADERLLGQAKSLLARLPFQKLDALLVEEIGKEISGSGMDYAVTGRTDLRGIPNPEHILINKLAVLRLTRATQGNAIGIGLADYIPLDCANAVDLKSMYENAITAAIGEKARLPIVLPTEREVLQALVMTSWARDEATIRYCQIRNTLDLDEVLVSGALLDELGGDAAAERLRFDDMGRMLTLL
jgi:hypothetical protein